MLQLFSDGRFHSGEDIARDIGITRAAVWKRLKRLQSETGLQLDSVRGRGYRARSSYQLLSRPCIEELLETEARARLVDLQVPLSTTSTNEQLARSPAIMVGRANVCLAEHQTAGRGRRGRVWVSPFGQCLYLSIAYRFDLALSDLASLGLVAGVVLAEVLAEIGLDSHRLKWPNDVVVEGKKLAGILVEASGESDGPALAIIGIGLNVGLDRSAAEAIDQPWIDLSRLGLEVADRNRLAAQLISALIPACAEFQRSGLSPFLPRWRQFDACVDQRVAVTAGNAVTEGRYLGVAEDGALLAETEEGVQRFHAGEVSLRTIL
jgi:BirA family biotin operon repressor/biotin-[acetyl-CoA-carboxylase] ligase